MVVKVTMREIMGESPMKVETDELGPLVIPATDVLDSPVIPVT